jgi:protein RecA
VDRDKALDLALANIEKQFGKGAVMKMGDDVAQKVAAIPTGALSLDLALGIGGLPRGRVVEIYGPESSGKCLTAGTYVWSDHGLETMEEVFARVGQPASCTSRVTDVRDHGVRLVNEEAQLETMAGVTHNNRRPVWRVELESGRHVEATANHPLRVLNEHGRIVWRTVGRLSKGDVLVSALFGAETSVGGSDLSEDEAVLLGYLVAEGTLGENARHAVVFTNAHDRDVLEEYVALVGQVLGVPAEQVRTYGGKDHHIHDTALRRRLADDYGLTYTDSAGKEVPHVVRTGGPKVQRAFLSALYEGDGWIESGPEIGLTTASRTLAEQVQLLLYGLGVPASLGTRYNDDLDRDYHTVLVPPGGARRFLEQVGFRSERRAEQVARHLAGAPETSLAARPLTYERVVSITPVGEQPTFDVVLPWSHSFVANGVLSHNTTVALHAVAEAQKMGGIAAFIDAEHALDPTYARALGVDINEMLVSQPDNGEQALEIAEMLIRSNAVDIVVIDSVAALVPRAEIEGEMGDSHVGLQARLMSQALRKLAGSLNRSKTCAVFINQLREKVGILFGSPETTPGGRALKFYSSVRIDVRRIETLKDGTDAVGNRVRAKVVKNKVSPPFRQAEFDILYGEGISKQGTLIDVGVEEGIIRKAGAWYTYDGEQLGQGKENARQFLKEHEDIALEIEKKIKEKLGVDPVAAEAEEPDVEVDLTDAGAEAAQD